MKILHLTTQEEWHAAQNFGEYRPPSLESEGFLQCSTDEQLLPVANAFYRDVEFPVVLWIDTDNLVSPLRWEPPAPADTLSKDLFPHVYGPLNLDAVVFVTLLKRDAEGRFVSL